MANRQAQSDLNSILSHDPRSALGRTARNLSVDLSTTPASRGRYGGGGPSAYEQAINNLIGGVEGSRAAAVKDVEDTNANAAKLEDVRQRGINELGVADTRAGASEYSADARSGATRYSADSRGDAMRDVATTRANTAKIDGPLEHQHAAVYNDARKRGLSQEDALKEANQYVAGFQSRGRDANGAGTPSSAIPQGAIDLLRKNPGKATDFDAMFGAGASKQYLSASGG